MHRSVLKLVVVGLVVAVLALPGFGQGGVPEKRKFVLAAGGREGLVYLPLNIADYLGYFKEAGLDIDIQNFSGGSQALRALVGGSADVVSGFYDHTIQLAAQGRRTKAFVMQQRYPGLVLAITKRATDQGVHTLADLRGKKIGVTAPGSSTHFFVNYLMTRAGVRLDDFSVLGIGVGPTAVAAVRSSQVDALSNVDPIITVLDNGGDLGAILADTRTTTGTLRVFGGPYPAACLYAKEEFIQQNPNTIQALTTAIIKALRWIKAHKAEDIVNAMPQEYYQGNKELFTKAVRASLESYSLDGRISPVGPPSVLSVFSFDPAIRQATITITDTYDMRFVEAYWKAQR